MGLTKQVSHYDARIVRKILRLKSRPLYNICFYCLHCTHALCFTYFPSIKNLYHVILVDGCKICKNNLQQLRFY